MLVLRRLAPAAAVALALGASRAAAQAPPTPAADSQRIALQAAQLDSLASTAQVSGVVLLAQGPTPVLQRTYGLADRAAKRPNTIDTRFNLGSISKVFTATAIRQLAEQGKLGLDDPLVRHLPDYPNADVARRVTIRQLLEHRSGIGGNIFDAPPGRTRADLRRNRDFLQLFAAQPLQFEPGTGQRYSNAGYVVLGAVIERVSGASYYDYVREHIFRPAGMTATDSYAKDSLPPNTALGYARDAPGESTQGPLRPNFDLLPGRGSAAGGGYSTAPDLLRFALAMQAGRIAGAPRQAMGIGGGAPGINALLEAGMPGGYTLVILANLDPPAAEALGRAVGGWLGIADDEGGRVMRAGPPH